MNYNDGYATGFAEGFSKGYSGGFQVGFNHQLQLPCKIGDDIWWIDNETMTVECEEHGVKGFVIDVEGIQILDKSNEICEIGTQYCYLTKEDAEKALATMKALHEMGRKAHGGEDG